MDNSFTVIKITAEPLGEENEVMEMPLDQLVNKIPQLVKVVETSPESLMETIVEHLELTPELICASGTCWENETHIYQLFHVSQEHEDEELPIEAPVGPLNQLGTLLVGREEAVYGNAILFKAEIQENHHGKNCSVELSDVEYLLKRRMKHTAVLIPAKGEIQELEFDRNPTEIIPEDQRQYYSCVELKLLTMNLLIYFLLQPENHDQTQINRRATRLFGEKKIQGPVYVVNQLTNHNFGDLTKSMSHDLLKICFDPLKKRELEGIELEHGKKVEGKPRILNAYRIIKLRAQDYQRKCHYCGSEENITVCTGCYRLCYHQKSCQQSDWRTHRNDCITSKKTLNQTTWQKLQDQQRRDVQKQIHDKIQNESKNNQEED